MLWVPVNRNIHESLIRQVSGQIRSHILQGELLAGSRLPSTRAMAHDLQVSRNVILEAYDQLLAEGYIESRPGSGTYVADGTYLAEEQATLKMTLPVTTYASTFARQATGDVIDFRPGLPALDLFPRKVWSQIAQRVYAEVPPAYFGYDTPEGRSELRSALAHYLLRTRGVRCHPDQIVITSGAAQALALTTQLLLRAKGVAILEDPVTYEIQTIYASTGATLHPIAVDEYGMQTELLPENMQPVFVHITPSHQFPLGGILPIQRRIQLIQFARATGCYLVEDDYDSEFRFSGPPVGSLQGLEPERVIYIGTFSKILSPALRLGYMILPMPLVEACRQVKRLSDLHSPSLDQLILARFIEMGHLERHIVKMKRVYRKRRDALLQSLQASFADQVSLLGDTTGLHLVAALHGSDFSTPDSVESLKKAGVLVYPVETHTIRKGMYRQHLVMGYSNLTCDEIVEGVRRIASVLRYT